MNYKYDQTLMQAQGKRSVKVNSSYIPLSKLKKSAWKGSVVCLMDDESVVGRVVLVNKARRVVSM